MVSDSVSMFEAESSENSDSEEDANSANVDILYKRRTEDKLYDSAVDMRMESGSHKYYLYKCGEIPQPKNGYLNFLRDYRRRNRTMTPLETLRKGAVAWKNLPEDMKKNYMKGIRLLTPEECAACGCTKKKKKRGCKPKKRACKPKKRACRPKKRSCRPKKKRSCRPKKKRC